MAEENTRILAGRYEVGKLLGRGGMAEVLLGRDTRLSRTVAIKVLRSDLARDPSFQVRFRREAQSAAALNHPAIVSVYDTGEDVTTDANGVEHRTPFIVMEYVEGHTVRELITEGEALPLAEAIEVTEGVLAALEYSHRAGIVHRDIKPGNIMITPAGEIKVMDFGIARAMADSAATMTQTHAVVGTAQYLSPEQARGEVVDTRSDLYSTGCVLFELLTGRPPFVGDSAVAVAYQHVSEPPAPPSTYASDIPEALDRIVLKALAKDRDQRYDTASAFRADLEAASRNEAISAGPIPAAPSAGEATTQLLSNPQGVAGAAAVGAGVAGGGTTTALPAAAGTDLLDDFPEPDEVPEETKKSRKTLIWILSILAVLLIGGIVYAFASQDKEPEGPVMVLIPDLEGKTYNEARDLLRAEGLEIDLNETPVPHPEIEKDLVVEWEPTDEAEEGSIVTVTLSAGPETVTVPDLEDKTLPEAQQIINEFNQENGSSLTLKEADEPISHDEIAEGRIVSWEPSGENVAPDAEIMVTLSSGPAEGVIPDIANLTEAAALRYLEAEGFTNVTIERENIPGRPSDQADRTVPAGGEEAEVDTEITLYVATGFVDIDSDQIIGESLEHARDYLRSLKFTDIREEESITDDAPQGSVVEITPPGVATVAYDQIFTLYYAMPPEPEPDPEPTSEEPTSEEPSPTDDGSEEEGEG